MYKDKWGEPPTPPALGPSFLGDEFPKMCCIARNKIQIENCEGVWQFSTPLVSTSWEEGIWWGGGPFQPPLRNHPI